MIQDGKRKMSPPEAATATRKLVDRVILDSVAPVKRALRDVPMPIASDSAHLIWTLRRSGSCRYLIVYNADVLRAQRGTVRFLHEGPVYDLTVGGPVKTGSDGDRQSVHLALPAGGWKVLLLSLVKVGRVTARVDRSGQVATLVVTVRDHLERAFSGIVPVHVEFLNAGAEAVLSRRRAAVAGLLEMPIAAEKGLAGATHVRVTEGAGGRATTVPMAASGQ
jgi:hypothetical protein